MSNPEPTSADVDSVSRLIREIKIPLSDGVYMLLDRYLQLLTTRLAKSGVGVDPGAYRIAAASVLMELAAVIHSSSGTSTERFLQIALAHFDSVNLLVAEKKPRILI